MTMILQTRAKKLNLDERVHFMGVLNLTPDSFSDGGKYSSPEAAIARAEELAEEGADIIDLGGESTRPGAAPVSLEEELKRVVPVVEAVAQRLPDIPLSVDTTKAEVARQCLEEGASIINDVSALRADPAMAGVAREHGVPVVLMHMQGNPATMQVEPRYDDVVDDIRKFFEARLAFCREMGLTGDVILDPGIGFGKTYEHNLEILRGLPRLASLGQPLLVGTSRKAFLGHLAAEGSGRWPAAGTRSSAKGAAEGSGRWPAAGARSSAKGAAEGGANLPPAERDDATVASCLWAAQAGARLLRVHNVKAVRRAMAVWRAIASPPAG